MHDLQLTPELFQGHVSLECVSGRIKPWRVPHERRSLFPPGTLNGKGENATGVRIRFESDTRTVRLSFEPFDAKALFDCVVDGELIATRAVEPGQGRVVFDGLDPKTKTLEIYLPHARPITVTGVEVDPGTSFAIPPDSRPRWVTYGSSITECAAAASPAQTWPALVARMNGWHLTCLGFGGNCHLEPNVARMIRDLPADFISLCLGINVYGGSSLGPRTFRAAVIGLIEIIREKHPTTPIAVLSPILSPPRETTPNAVGFTLEQMRDEVRDAVRALEALGDEHLHYTDGRDVFGREEAQNHLPDNLHPDAEGYRLMAHAIDAKVVRPIRNAYASLQGSA